MQDELQRIADSGTSHVWLDRPGGLFLRRAELMSDDDRVLLRAVARAIFEGARGGLEVQLRRPLLPSGAANAHRDDAREFQTNAMPRPQPEPSGSFFNGFGGFTERRARISRIGAATGALVERRRKRTRSALSRRNRVSATRGRRTAIRTG